MSDTLQNAVAIIGIAGRFPGAENVEQFWQNLCAGRESIRTIPEWELEDGLTAAQRSRGKYVAARAVLKDVDLFDAEFFHILPREAEVTDPQQRVLMECAWEALEDAGYDPARIAGNVGVFAGSSINTYLLLHLASDPSFREEFTRSYQVGSFPTLVGNGHDFLATRISYKLNLRGPAMTVQSACSTSLLAVAQAWQSLVNYQSDLALAGGVSISFPQMRGYFYQDGGMVSVDGHCRPFDAAATGTVFGGGAGMVLLKRAEEAIADGDHIYALLLGAGVNNDGSDKVGYAAPSRKGQTDAIAMAYAVAGVDPASVDYVECHGTGTPLGDPIEVAALAEAFGAGAPRTAPCLLSSVKGNIGHLDVAAGVTGLVKAALSLDRERIPGTLHYSEPNPRLDLPKLPFIVASTATEWPRGRAIRRAGVSAFGFGGTNVHVVLEEAPVVTTSAAQRPQQLLCMAARTSTALEAQCARLADSMERADPVTFSLPDVAYTLAVGRRAFAHRLAVVANTREECIARLRNLDALRSRTAIAKEAPRVAMLFPGQGTQHPGMAEDIYRTEPFYREIVDRCCKHLVSLAGLDLLPVLFPKIADPNDSKAWDDAAQALEQTRYAQPALFVTSYALAKLWMHWGVQPACLVGHSVGELVAACLAGVFSLEDALLFVARRGEWMQELPTGSMLAVRMQSQELQKILPANLSVAAVNSLTLTVASGPTAEIDLLAKQLERGHIACRRLRTSHAFHSAMVDPIVERLRAALSSMELNEPKLEILSTVTGDTLTHAEATSPEYWARHSRVAVNFSAAANTLVREGFEILLEAGAGDTLITLVRQHLPRGSKTMVAFPSLPAESLHPAGPQKSSWDILAGTVGALWSHGIPVDWDAYYAGEHRRRVALPTYPFERKRHWVEAKRELRATDAPFVAEPTEAPPLEIVENIPPEEGSGIDMNLSTSEKVMTRTANATMDNATATIIEDRSAQICQGLASLVEDLSGLELTAEQYDLSFLELGFDSLFLTQVAQKIQNKYAVKIAFRQLLDNLSSIRLVAEYLDAQMPQTSMPTAPVNQVQETLANQPRPAAAANAAGVPGSLAEVPPNGSPVEGARSGFVADGQIAILMQQQLQAVTQLIQSQLQILSGGQTASVAASRAIAPTQHFVEKSSAATRAEEPVASAPPAPTPAEGKMLRKQSASSGQHAMTAEQQRFLEQLIERYCKKTAQSKSFAQQHRRTLADPRGVNGFRPEWKEMVYSLVSPRSKGSKFWDIDGNEYIDLVNGFGPTMFGHAPDFVVKALQEQIQEGFAIGPQTPLAGRAANLLTELTGTERVTFCNTGSEAVMAAMRVARTVTGRDRVVFFAGDYHGQFDEVLVKQLKRKGDFLTQPAAPGIPRENLGNVTVLDYGTEESLRYIERHASELAAVLVEPVQSRHPKVQPKEFLSRVREITRQSGTAFIFDEVVTGFRIHPRGAQGYYGIDADLVTYGKVVGGGMPIGILAGRAVFMDALDGGPWEFGDASVPEAGVTFFAGTFVRHPLTMAALCATLEHIRDAGEALYDTLNERASRFGMRLNEVFTRLGVPLQLETCGSVMYVGVPLDVRFGGLLFYLLREKGIFALEGFPLYLTTEHSDADVDRILRAFEESIVEMQSCGFFPGHLGVGGMPSVLASAPQPEKETVAVTEIPLTEPQLEIMLAAQVSDDANCAFNESFRLSLDGALDVETLKLAWRSLVDRHDALRMSLVPAGDRMRIHRDRLIAMQDVDLSGHSASAQQDLLDTMIIAEGKQPFELVQGPLVRAQLVKLAPEKHLLLITAHHLICDGWTVNVLVDELGKMYSAALHHRSPELSPVLPFSQYALDVQQSQWREQQESDLAYWKQQLTPEPELLTLPSDRSHPAARSFEGSTYIADFPKAFVAALRKAGAQSGCTLFTTLLAGWQILLWRLSGNPDPVTLIPSAAQSLMDDKVLVGHCVHLLPIRAALTPEMAAADYMRALKPAVLDAYEHQHATYGSIVRALTPRRESGRLPLSEIQFNLEQVGRCASFEGIQTEVRANGKRAVNFDLFLNIVDTGNGLRLECDYSTGLYDESTVACWIRCYRALLESMISNPAQSVVKLEILGPELRTYLLETCNATATATNAAENVPELIHAAFASMPEQPAADFYGMELTRAQLTEQSDRLASWLMRNGAGLGSLVGIYMDRSLDMLVAMLGVMKAGAAYVPLDPMFPPARIAQIVEETNVPVMITLSGHLDALPQSQAKVIALDTEADKLAVEPKVALPKISANARAYVIFTSGSTGRPKGVEVCHGSVVNLLADTAQRLEMKPQDRLLAVTTLSFDIAVLEMLLPMVSGGTVVIAHRDDVADGAQLVELLQATRATVLQATPVTWRMLIEQGFQPPAGFKMLCGGEAWTPAMADQLLVSGGRLWNMYGPTETTVWSSITEVKRGATRMTIGPPIANTRFYVLDRALQLVPPGVSGELLIAGDGVARGYFNRPELTAEKFLLNPFKPGERMYRTGDEVRQLPDGRIEFLGRLDQQIKLRGFRIELGDVETALRGLPGVRDAVAVLRPDASGEAILVGYYTGGDNSTQAELKRALGSQLPAYMIPTILKPLDKLPLTPNGKIDRRALPEPRAGAEAEKAEFFEPGTRTETILAEIFCEVLGCSRISIRTSLLDQGADSLRMFQIASRAHRRGFAVSAKQLMQLHTVEAVAAAIDASESSLQAVPVSAVRLERVSRENYRVG
ncbi:MAG: amino acid adenylation domain-containing protein [Terriglobia bacterium]|nr:amino acid adenylation domain-containing protein [Terriglobia bacterium]